MAELCVLRAPSAWLHLGNGSEESHLHKRSPKLCCVSALLYAQGSEREIGRAGEGRKEHAEVGCGWLVGWRSGVFATLPYWPELGLVLGGCDCSKQLSPHGVRGRSWSARSAIRCRIRNQW